MICFFLLAEITANIDGVEWSSLEKEKTVNSYQNLKLTVLKMIRKWRTHLLNNPLDLEAHKRLQQAEA